MISSKSAFCANYIFSLASRERCMANLKKFRFPNGWKPTTPAAPNAAVLIPLCNVEDRPSLLYTIRSPNLRTHTGQISFPGGKMEENETPTQAALRNTQLEIGLSPTKVDIWGHGPSIPSRNQNVLITPVIGTILDVQKKDMNINFKEVSEVFAVPLELLCDPRNQFYTQFRNGYVLPVFIADDYKIWGITAYMTHTLLSCLMPKETYRNDWTKKKIDMREGDVQQDMQ